MSEKDLDTMAAEIAMQTKAPVAQVRGGLEQMTPAMRADVCKRFGLSYTPNGRKRGRPEDPVLTQLRGLFPEKSPRTIARYARALRLLTVAGVSEDVRRNLVETYSRPGGSFNVSGFEQHAEFLIWAQAHEDRPGQQPRESA